VRDDRDVSALFAAVDAYLREQRRPWSAYPATFCARCGRRIVAGDGQIDLALLYPARRCAACYDHESHGGVDDKPDGHGGMAALMQCDVGGAVCYAPRKRVNYQSTNWCARHRIWCQRLVLSYLVVYTERGNTSYYYSDTYPVLRCQDEYVRGLPNYHWRAGAQYERQSVAVVLCVSAHDPPNRRATRASRWCGHCAEWIDAKGSWGGTSARS